MFLKCEYKYWLLIAILWLLLLLPPLFGKPPQFSLPAEKPPQFSLTEDKPVVELPTDPNQPAPQGYQWQSVNGGPWKLVKVSEVASPARPFPDTIPVTSALPAAVRSTSSLGSTRMARTIIDARSMGRSGVTDCKA